MADDDGGRRNSSSRSQRNLNGARTSHNGRDVGPRSLYRLNSNQSSSSVFEDVEMAQDEVRIPPVYFFQAIEWLGLTS